MKAGSFDCIREENTKFTGHVVPSLLWKTGTRTDTSSQMPRNWFLKVLKAVLLTKASLKTLYSSFLAVSVQVWVTAVQEQLRRTERKRTFREDFCGSFERKPSA